MTAAYATLVERTAFRVRHERLAVLPPGSASIRVLHLADQHLAPWQRGKVEWLRSLAALEPDLVVSTGDALGHRDAIPALAESLEPLRGIPGVFVHGSNDVYGPVLKNPLRYVLGPSSRGARRHEPDLDTAALEAVYADLGWLDLDNAARGLEVAGTRLELFGVHDAHHGWDRLDVVADELATLRTEADWTPGTGGPVSIGVTHSPYRRILDAFVREGADVVFAGHTHGGQVRIPGGPALVANCDVPREQASGVSTWRHGGASAVLQVSQGIGTSIYAPFRLGTPPEAVLVSLEARRIG
ncbi:MULTISPECIES: metallophosphoesterase [unclassified Agrococcus]|uniref:metallophosphoesterase n=1 Tax=unclassified Agrococcus TaxID=2615065 RepID=UPI00362284F2